MSMKTSKAEELYSQSAQTPDFICKRVGTFAKYQTMCTDTKTIPLRSFISITLV